MRFLVDAQLPPALARWIASSGHLAAHVTDHGMAGASDTAIWALAMSIDAAILTKDEDFAARRIQAVDGPPIVWLRPPNMRRRQLMTQFEPMLQSIVQALEAGETLIELV